MQCNDDVDVVATSLDREGAERESLTCQTVNDVENCTPSIQA